MNELKFRAWDTVSKYMFVPAKISFLKKIAYEVRGFDCSGDPLYRKHLFKNIIIMQYIGLKDDSKEEQELFEGDLIKNGNGKILLIYFNKLECSFRQTTNLKNPGERIPCYTDLPMNYNNKIKVGNIHENPELIE